MFWTAEDLFNRSDFGRRDARAGLARLAREDLGIEIACKRIKNHAISHSIFRVALFHEGIHDQLAVTVCDGLLNHRFPVGTLRRNLVERGRYPFADSEVGKTGAHRRVTNDNSVEGRRIALREDHSFTTAGRTSGEI